MSPTLARVAQLLSNDNESRGVASESIANDKPPVPFIVLIVYSIDGVQQVDRASKMEANQYLASRLVQSKYLISMMGVL